MTSPRPAAGRLAYLIVAVALGPAAAGAHAAASGAEAPRALLRLAPWSADGDAPQAPWRVIGLPDRNGGKPYTTFALESLDGRRALRIEAERSYGNLIHPLRAEAGAHRSLSWHWRVSKLNDAADLRSKAGDDTTVKVCAMFDLPLARLPFAERQLMRMARALSNEPLPAATVCYVWDSRLPAGTELPSAFTGRLRYVVLESGTARAGQWVAERRDLVADFRRLFGDESGGEPVPLAAIAVGADADNTGRRSVAHVADLMLEP